MIASCDSLGQTNLWKNGQAQFFYSFLTYDVHSPDGCLHRKTYQVQKVQKIQISNYKQIQISIHKQIQIITPDKIINIARVFFPFFFICFLFVGCKLKTNKQQQQQQQHKHHKNKANKQNNQLCYIYDFV